MELNALKNLADICLSKSKKLGSSDASVLVINSVSENVNIRNRKIDGSERSDNLGITLTTFIGKKKACITSSNLTEENINTLVKRCIDATKVTPEDEFNSLPDKDLHFKGVKDLKLFDIFKKNDEIFDNNADFDTSTYTFTAPVTGRYNLSLSLYFTDVQDDAIYLEVYLTTSNRTYYFIIDPEAMFERVSSYHTITASVLADMDASDTASVSYRQSGGTASTDFNGSDSFFSGFLALSLIHI